MTRCHWCQKRATTTDNGGKPLCSKQCKSVPLSERPAKAKRRTLAQRKVKLPQPKSSSYIIPTTALGNILRNIPSASPRRNGARWDGFIRLLKLVGGEHDELDKFVEHWDALPPAKRLKISPEDICAAIDVGPARLLGILAETCYTLGRDQSRLIAAVSEPLVVGVMTKQAMTKDGFNDRRLFLQSSGYAPSPQTSISVTQDNRKLSVNQSVGGLDEMDAEAMRFAEIVHGQKQLPSPLSFEPLSKTDDLSERQQTFDSGEGR